MTPAAETARASVVVVATGMAWGLYWLPVRALEAAGLPGAWGTVAITALAAVLLTPVAWRRRGRLAAASPLGLAAFALGGAAFALYSVGFVYGRVAIVILLWFLTPVWSVLIGRYVMGWSTPPLRIAAIACGLAGLAVMLSADGGPPVPRSAGEWMALSAGALWSVATTGMRVRPDLGPGDGAWVFALGALAATLVLAPMLGPLPSLAPGAGLAVAGWAGLAAALWWGASIAGLMWATVRLEPARSGILLMSEVLVGAVSAALLAGEALHPLEIAGGALVLAAGALEVWPTGRPPA
ncbi:DMT family transporter [Rhodobacteraceae bacterium CCMM004]|nr:DMT family transporter [Rhodobacteraceae bacterium CCMM004]